jgi:hypothetical protein
MREAVPSFWLVSISGMSSNFKPLWARSTPPDKGFLMKSFFKVAP